MNIAEKLRFADDLKSKIEELKPQKSWDDAFYKRVKIDFTYTSNKLEGNTLTYGQTIQLLRDFVTPKNASPGERRQWPNWADIYEPNLNKEWISANFH